MIGINFGKWSTHYGAIFCHRRIYWDGSIWTPFTRVFWLYCVDPRVEADAPGDSAAGLGTATFSLRFRGQTISPPLTHPDPQSFIAEEVYQMGLADGRQMAKEEAAFKEQD